MLVVDSGVGYLALVHGHHVQRLASDQLMMPELFDLEIVQKVRWDVLQGRLSEAEGHRALARLEALVAERHPHLPLLPRIWELRQNVTAYDAAYISLAEREGATLLTADGRLSRAAGIRCPVEVAD